MTCQKQHACLSLTFTRNFFVWSAVRPKCGNEYSVIHKSISRQCSTCMNEELARTPVAANSQCTTLVAGKKLVTC